MNIRITKGQKVIKLDKGERAAMVKAMDVCRELHKQTEAETLQVHTRNACNGLMALLAEFPERAATE